jgi:hypothetical protein
MQQSIINNFKFAAQIKSVSPIKGNGKLGGKLKETGETSGKENNSLPPLTSSDAS